MERAAVEARLGVLRSGVMPILEYSQRELKDFTTHGHRHSEGVEKLLRDIISRCNRNEGECNIQIDEEYILICAAWLHDLGNITGRDDHNRKTCDIIRRLSPMYISGLHPDYTEFVIWVCLAHSREESINSVPLEIPFGGINVKLRYITSIFRIADAGDMSSRSAPIGAYEIIKDKLSKKSDSIWRSHQAVRDVSFLQSGSSIIITVKDKRKASRAVRDFKDEFRQVEYVLESYGFPYTDVHVVREKVAPYRGRLSLT